MVTGQEWHFEPSVRRVLGANKEPKAESANRESPSRDIVAAPTADEPGEDQGDQPGTTNPDKVMPHRRIYDYALGASGLLERRERRRAKSNEQTSQTLPVLA